MPENENSTPSATPASPNLGTSPQGPKPNVDEEDALKKQQASEEDEQEEQANPGEQPTAYKSSGPEQSFMAQGMALAKMAEMVKEQFGDLIDKIKEKLSPAADSAKPDSSKVSMEAGQDYDKATKSPEAEGPSEAPSPSAQASQGQDHDDDQGPGHSMS